MHILVVTSFKKVLQSVTITGAWPVSNFLILSFIISHRHQREEALRLWLGQKSADNKSLSFRSEPELLLCSDLAAPTHDYRSWMLCLCIWSNS